MNGYTDSQGRFRKINNSGSAIHIWDVNKPKPKTKKDYKLKVIVRDGNKRIEKTFSKYTMIGDWLDSNPHFAGKSIALFNSNSGLPKTIKFNGGQTFIEGYGNV